MKVTITSTYENVDEEWLAWWIDRLKKEEVMPGCQKMIKELKQNGSAKFTSKDPKGPVVATTEYSITGR